MESLKTIALRVQLLIDRLRSYRQSVESNQAAAHAKTDMYMMVMQIASCVMLAARLV